MVKIVQTIENEFTVKYGLTEDNELKIEMETISYGGRHPVEKIKEKERVCNNCGEKHTMAGVFKIKEKTLYFYSIPLRTTYEKQNYTCISCLNSRNPEKYPKTWGEK